MTTTIKTNKPVKMLKPVEPTKLNKPLKIEKPAKVEKPSKPSKPEEPTKPAKPAEPEKPPTLEEAFAKVQASPAVSIEGYKLVEQLNNPSYNSMLCKQATIGARKFLRTQATSIFSTDSIPGKTSYFAKQEDKLTFLHTQVDVKLVFASHTSTGSLNDLVWRDKTLESTKGLALEVLKKLAISTDFLLSSSLMSLDSKALWLRFFEEQHTNHRFYGVALPSLIAPIVKPQIVHQLTNKKEMEELFVNGPKGQSLIMVTNNSFLPSISEPDEESLDWTVTSFVDQQNKKVLKVKGCADAHLTMEDGILNGWLGSNKSQVKTVLSMLLAGNASVELHAYSLMACYLADVAKQAGFNIQYLPQCGHPNLPVKLRLSKP